jgi:superoxide dismutase, Cu-Zn family
MYMPEVYTPAGAANTSGRPPDCPAPLRVYLPRMMIRNTIKVLLAGALLAIPGTALAAKSVKVPIHHIDTTGVGKSAGTITIKETKDGLELSTALKGLPPGEHGFHLHENGSCAPADKDGVATAGQSAGAHYDPDATKAHKGPGGGGHKGDLPKLEIDEKGAAKGKHPVPGLKLADVAGRALMIHEGGDNYADAPKPLGGGGARIACGVIPGKAKTAAAAAPAAPAGHEGHGAHGAPGGPAKPAETKPAP